MKIILIDPEGDQPGINVGLAYLSASLKKNNINTKVIDLNNYRMSFQNLKDEIIKFKPGIIGYSIKTATYYSAIELSRRLKIEFPYIYTAAGGPHIILTHKDFLRKNPHINFLIIGEGEKVLPDLCKSIDNNISINNVKGITYFDSGKIISNSSDCMKDLNKLPFPDFKNFILCDFSRYNYPLITSRGCPYKCIYCSVSRISGPKWRYRDPENVVEELIYANKNYNIKEFDILDDVFTLKINRAIKFCELLIKKNIDLPWSCPNGIRADNVSEELAEIMFRSGCHTITIGIESSDEKVFNFINKGESLSQIEKAVRIFKKAGIRVGGYFIIGLPYDNYQKTKKSLEYAKKINLDWAHFNLLSLYPQTKVWNWIKKNGIILDDYRKAAHFGGKARPVFETSSFKAKEMVKAYKMVHTKQLLFHLITPDIANPWKKNITRISLLLKYNIKFLLKQMMVIISTFPCRILKICLYEFEKITLRFFSIFIKGRSRHKAQPDKKKKSLKILHLNNIYDHTGGVEIYLINTCKQLLRLGHKVIIIYDKGNPRIISDRNCKAYHIPFISEYDSQHDRGAQKKLKEIIKKEDPDIIHLHNIYNPRTVLNAASSSPSLKTMHDYYSLCPALNKYLRGSDKICKKSFGLYCLWRMPWDHCAGAEISNTFDRIFIKISEIKANKKFVKMLVASKYMKKELAKNGFPSSNTGIQPYFSELSVNRGKNISPSEKMILTVGRISLPDKGFDHLLEALSYLKIDFQAVIVGDGPSLNYLKQKAQDLGLNDKVKFTGWLSRKAMQNYYNKCRMVVIPSMWAEPFGIVGIEAMTYSKPVIAFNVGGISDFLVHNKNGYLIKRGKIKKMAEKMKLLLENPNLAKKMGKEGSRIVKNKYSRQVSMNKLMETYWEMVKNKKT